MKILFDIALYIPLLPLGLLLFPVGREHLVKSRLMLMLIAIIAIAFMGELWLRIGNENNLPFFHLYIVVEFYFLAGIFRALLNNRIKRKTWICIVAVYTAIWLVNGLLGPGFWSFPDFSRASEATLVLFFVVLWFVKMLEEKKIKNPVRNFEFWFCTSLFVFFSGNFLVFVFSNFIMKTDPEVFYAVWAVHAFLVILQYTLYAFAIVWIPKTTK